MHSPETMSSTSDNSRMMDTTGGILMRMHVVIVCATVGALGFITVVLGVAGETSTAEALVGKRINDFASVKCVYRTTPALGCGVVAALLALTAQVVVTAAGICCGCCRTWEVPTVARRIVGIVLSAVSWILVIIVVVLFIVGAALNTDQERQPTADDKCYVAPGNGAFAAATILSLIVTGCQIASYILLQTIATGSMTPLSQQQQQQQPSEVAMAQPELKKATDQATDGGDLPPSAPPAIPEATAEPGDQV
ncbi:hypothetical protein ACP70R_020723 [Stipagrostis hirtigluma subsp. patula]